MDFTMLSLPYFLFSLGEENLMKVLTATFRKPEHVTHWSTSSLLLGMDEKSKIQNSGFGSYSPMCPLPPGKIEVHTNAYVHLAPPSANASEAIDFICVSLPAGAS
jgi:hypothetical protein